MPEKLMHIEFEISDSGYLAPKSAPLTRSQLELGPLGGQYMENPAIEALKLPGGRYKLFQGVTYTSASGEKFSIYRWDRLEDEFVSLHNKMIRFEPVLNVIKKQPLGMLKQIDLLRNGTIKVINPQGIVNEYCARFYEETGAKFIVQ